MSRRWLVAFAAASACGGQPRAPASPADQLGAIRIVGNRAIASDSLESALALHEAIGGGGALDPYLLSLDTDRIRAAYMKRGFFAVTVAPRVEQRERGSQVAVFAITEGRRAATRVEITGLPPEVPPAAARALVELPDGAPFDYEVYDAAKQPLTELIENAGYAHVEVRGTVDGDPVAAVAAVRYDVHPGPRCTFGAIRIAGNVHPDLAAAVRARLRFATGDRYSSAALAASQAEIYDVARFSSVQVVADRGGAGQVIDVAVELVEANRHELHAGFGLGVEPVSYEARVLGGGSLVPAARPLVTLATDARVAVTLPRTTDTSEVEPKVRLLGSLQRIDLGWPRVRGEIEGGLDYQTLEAYTWSGAHVRLGLGAPIVSRWLRASIGWVLEGLTFRNIQVIDPDPETTDGQTLEIARRARSELGLAGSHLRGAYQGSLIADLRDDPIEPHGGGYLAVTTSVGTRLAGGDLEYVQVTPELRGYVSLGELVVAVRGRAGAILGQVPVTERYYSGGTGQRGFSARYLAPRVVLDPAGCSDTGRAMSAAPDVAPSSIAIGGAGLIETGIELRRPIASLGGVPVGANLFLDGADVRCRPEDLDPVDLHWAVGVGLWSKLAGLKVRGELGYRLNRKGPGELSGGPSGLGDFAWHIGIGETF